MKFTRVLTLLTGILLMPWLAGAQSKKALDHTVFDSWNDLKGSTISDDGSHICYEVDPQVGDGWMYIYNTGTRAIDSVARGYHAHISPADSYVAFSIKAPFNLIRKAKVEKKKKEDMPLDSLGIYIFGSGKLMHFANLKSFKMPDESSDWFVFALKPSEDTIKSDGKKKTHKKADTEIFDLKIMNPVSGGSFSFDSITDYTISKNGKLVSMVRQTADSAAPMAQVIVFNTDNQKEKTVFAQTGTAGNVVIDEDGKQTAFLFSADTIKEKVYNLFYWKKKSADAVMLIDTASSGMPTGWSVSIFKALKFSKKGDRIFLGTAPKPVHEPKDTIPQDEKAILDIWHWQDGKLMPQQLVELKKENERTYLAVYNLKDNYMVQLADKLTPDVEVTPYGNGDYAIAFNSAPYEKLMSWEGFMYRDVYLVNMMNGERNLLLHKKAQRVDLSPDGKYVLWYEMNDSSWYAHDIAEDRLISLTRELPVHFYEETFDEPTNPYPYGFAGWSGDDRYVFIYDRYDIWKIDLAGKYEPLNLTNGYGRKTQTQFRYRKIDREEYYISLKEPLFLSSYNENTKETGFCSSSPLLQGDPIILISGPYSYSLPVKSRYEDVLIWSRGNFRDYPDIYTSDLSFSTYQKISNANPQSEKYLWGDVRLVHWISYDNEPLDGILYTPEQMEKGKKYPVMIYFYEKMSQTLFSHRIPSPSRSTINIPYCVSNGYIVFIPDIHYKNGYPGQSAYNCVVSGTMAMADRFDFIDRDHMAIQGQSWGGYQVAYLVTRINPYAAAMAGAPVSNMTSAYGGIRWGSGMSRMWQYEEAQSRIGGTLWEKTSLYLENSPLFHVPKIETPLLIMHNDNDGAVPWYQGIELFVALRRLNKPAWMLVYNNEEHNLTKWPNRVDLSIRMMQFFDHYLKGAPAPEWMY